MDMCANLYGFIIFSPILAPIIPTNIAEDVDQYSQIVDLMTSHRLRPMVAAQLSSKSKIPQCWQSSDPQSGNEGASVFNAPHI